MAHGAHTKRLRSPHHTSGASRHTRGANQQQQQLRRPHLARIWLMVATMSSVFSAMCCSPGPSFCSRKVWIWLFLQAGRQAGGGTTNDRGTQGDGQGW